MKKRTQFLHNLYTIKLYNRMCKEVLYTPKCSALHIPKMNPNRTQDLKKDINYIIKESCTVERMTVQLFSCLNNDNCHIDKGVLTHA